MYVVIKSNEASHIETKLHQLGACISDIVGMIHSAKHISHIPEEYVDHARGRVMHSMHDSHPMHEGYRPDGYYAPTERYPHDGADYARGRGRY